MRFVYNADTLFMCPLSLLISDVRVILMMLISALGVRELGGYAKAIVTDVYFVLTFTMTDWTSAHSTTTFFSRTRSIAFIFSIKADRPFGISGLFLRLGYG